MKAFHNISSLETMVGNKCISTVNIGAGSPRPPRACPEPCPERSEWDSEGAGQPCPCSKSLLSIALFFALILSSSLASAQEGTITTVAGTGTAGYSGDGGPATQAQLNGPSSVAVDSSGNMYIADYYNQRVRKVATSGVITTVTATAIGPSVAVDSIGNLYIGESNNHRVLKVDSSGTITTVAGTGTRGYGGDGGLATQAQLNHPGVSAVDSTGNIYIPDYDNHRVRKVDTSGIITTVAGTGTAGYSGDGGAATQAQLSWPVLVTVDSAGNLYVTGSENHRVRKINTSGIITTVAGTGTAGFSGDGGPATQAQINDAHGVATDSAGNLYIADRNNQRVRRVDPSGIIITVAGTGAAGSGGDNGLATQAQLNTPSGMGADSSGNLYIADYGNHRVRKVTFAQPTGTISGTVTNSSTGSGISGAVVSTTSGGYRATTDSSGNYTISNVPAGTYTLVASANGYSTAQQANVSVASGGTATVNLSLLQAYITTVAGTGTAGFSGDGGPATQAQLNAPHNIAIDSFSNLFIADYANQRIREVNASGIMTTVAGTGTAGFSGDGGAATQAQLNYALDVALDVSGNLYIADTENHRVRNVNSSGVITTFAGTGSTSFSGDGASATLANIGYPNDVAIDISGNLYISDETYHRIRKVNTAGIIATVVGTGTPGFSGDGGPATQAQLSHPIGIAADGNGNLYIADYANHRVRKVDVNGTITTVAGNGVADFGGDAGLATQAQIASAWLHKSA